MDLRQSLAFYTEQCSHQTIWEDGAYEFSIINENSLNSPNDKDVQRTVVAIIEEFFRNNPDILLYQCETGDNKQSARERLFFKWFSDYASDKYSIRVTKIVAEGVANYAAVIVQRDNPQIERIFNDFDNFTSFFTDKPQQTKSPFVSHEAGGDFNIWQN